MFSRLYKCFEKVFTELHFVKMNTAHVLIDKNFLDLQKYFRDNPVILLTMENISNNHNGFRKGLEKFLKSNYEDE